MLTRFFQEKCFGILMKFYKTDFFFINKDHGKRYLLCVLLYILKFALEKKTSKY